MLYPQYPAGLACHSCSLIGIDNVDTIVVIIMTLPASTPDIPGTLDTAADFIFHLLLIFRLLLTQVFILIQGLANFRKSLHQRFTKLCRALAADGRNSVYRPLPVECCHNF